MERAVAGLSVYAAHVEAVTNYFVALAAAETEADRSALTHDTKWTPVK